MMRRMAFLCGVFVLATALLLPAVRADVPAEIEKEDPLETSNAFAGAKGEEAVGELKDGLLDWLLCARPHLPPKRYPW